MEAFDLYTFSSGRVRRRTRAGRGSARQEAAHLEAPGTCAGARPTTPVLSSIGPAPPRPANTRPLGVANRPETHNEQ
jgi:hypothetical protein